MSLNGNIYFVACKRLEVKMFVSILQVRDLDRVCIYRFKLLMDMMRLYLLLEKSSLPCYLTAGVHMKLIEIWITTKIETNAVSWTNFLKVDHMIIFNVMH